MQVLASRRIPILMYHSIGHASAKSKFRAYVVAPWKLRWQFLMLKVLGYRALSMSDLLPYLLGEKQGRVVGLTFDDGYLDNIEHALPLLKKYGYTATCYIISGLLGQHNIWEVAKGGTRKALMTETDVLLWKESGMEVGAHTTEHADLVTCHRDEVNRQVKACKAELEALIGTKVSAFAYPYGCYSNEVKEVISEAGFDTAVTADRARVASGDDLLELPRISVSRSTYTWKFLRKLMTSHGERRRSKVKDL
jgi:peptidoglycan/xylan/chitin deacetylase (PgdA/CDA1 family)